MSFMPVGIVYKRIFFVKFWMLVSGVWNVSSSGVVPLSVEVCLWMCDCSFFDKRGREMCEMTFIYLCLN